MAGQSKSRDTDAAILEKTKALVHSRFESSKASYEEGRSLDQWLGSAGVTRAASRVVASDVREIGHFRLPNRTRLWVYRSRTDAERAYVLGWQSRLLLEREGSVVMNAYDDRGGN